MAPCFLSNIPTSLAAGGFGVTDSLPTTQLLSAHNGIGYKDDAGTTGLFDGTALEMVLLGGVCKFGLKDKSADKRIKYLTSDWTMDILTCGSPLSAV